MLEQHYLIRPIERKVALDLIIKHHYLHRQAPGKFCYGLFYNEELIGIIMYGVSASTTLRKGICGPEHCNNVYELTRLWLKDGLPKNLASYFISRTVKLLDKEIIVSYADPSQGHTGYVYQACNWLYTGLSSKFRDPVLKSKPNLHHTGFAKGFTNEEIKQKYGNDVEFKKRTRKHRYVYFNASKTSKKHLIKSLKYKILPYPKTGTFVPISKDQQKCKKCGVVRNLNEYGKGPVYKGKAYVRKTCNICYKELKSSEEYKERSNARRRTPEFRAKKNAKRKTEEYRKKDRVYNQKTLKKNPLIRVKKNLRNRLRIGLRVKKWKKTTKFYDYIGCSQLELKTHLEGQFKENMTWQNYGEWEIDHIIPLSSAKTPEEMYKLCHYSNLQPLWAIDNLSKSNKIPQ